MNKPENKVGELQDLSELLKHIRPATEAELKEQGESLGRNYKPGPRQAVTSISEPLSGVQGIELPTIACKYCGGPPDHKCGRYHACGDCCGNHGQLNELDEDLYKWVREIANAHGASLERERVLQTQISALETNAQARCEALGFHMKRAEAVESQLSAVLERESATTKRYDDKLEAAESQLRELREIVKDYRDGSHPLCLKAVKYPDGLMDDRCSTCKAADLFLEKAEGK